MRFMFRLFLIDSPLVGLGKPNIYQNLEDFTRMKVIGFGVFSICEELSRRTV